MALPSGVQTCEVTFGPFTDFLGNPVSGRVTFRPSRSLIWIATGAPLLASDLTVTLDESGLGHTYLPYTNQTGFSDGAGHTVTNWTYRAVFALVGVENPEPFSFQVPTGPASMDLDLATPVGSSSGTTVDMPSVISVNGMTGVVELTGGSGGPHNHNISDIYNLQTTLDLKAPLANPTFTGSVIVPTPTASGQAVNKGYVDSLTTTIVDATTSVKGKIKLAGDLAGTADLPTVPGLVTLSSAITTLNSTVAGKANTSDVVAITGNQTIGGVKTFTQGIGLPDETLPVVKVAGLTSALAAKVSIGGDLSGTATAPTVSKVRGITVSATAPTTGQMLVATSATTAEWQGSSTSISIAGMPAGSMLRVLKDPVTGFWPASWNTDGTPVYTGGSTSNGVRPTARGDICIVWVGQSPHPPIVTSGTAGIRDNIDMRIVLP